MKIAYIVSAYKLPQQVVRLVHRLLTHSSLVLLHVDQRSDPTCFAHIAHELGSLDGVHFLHRHPCQWGDFGHVAATLEGIRALSEARADFDYAILLTGQDYPIKPASEIAAFFAEHRGKLFMEHFPLPSDHWAHGGMDRVQFWHVRFWGRHFRFPPAVAWLPRRSAPRGLKLFGGSSYWCFTRECVEFIAHFVLRERNVVRFFKFVDVPDELFFQSMIMSSPFRHAVVNDNLRYIDWKDPAAGSPGVLTRADFGALASSPKLFARKFDVTQDPGILDLIDDKLLDLDCRGLAANGLPAATTKV
jgi:hypothetical protein